MEKYEDYYLELGIRPGDSWQKLRSAYKSQMRRWHPDRFGLDDPMRHKAEEKTKVINQSYQELAEFYQLNGKLPLDAAQHPNETSGNSTRAETAPASSSTINAGWGSPIATDETRIIRTGLRPGVILTLILVLVAIYVFWEQDIFMSRHETSTAPANSQATHLAGTEKPVVTSGTGEVQTFGMGATLGEVYSIQGVPSLVEGDIWHYGEAHVYFHNGRVTRWVDSADHRLKVQTAGAQPAQIPVVTTFGIGSTHDEVRAIQGSPLRESGNVWDYGLSRVYFDSSGHVTGWQESPLNLLHVKH
jgi:hypothetical protein